MEQPRVFDGDNCLGGKVLDQRNLLIGERANFLTEDRDDTNEFVLMEHRYAEDTAMTAKRDGRDAKRIALDIASFRHHVGDLDRSLCVCRAPKASAGMWMQNTRARLLIGGGRVVRRNGAKAAALVEVSTPNLASQKRVAFS